MDKRGSRTFPIRVLFHSARCPVAKNGISSKLGTLADFMLMSHKVAQVKGCFLVRLVRPNVLAFDLSAIVHSIRLEWFWGHGVLGNTVKVYSVCPYWQHLTVSLGLTCKTNPIQTKKIANCLGFLQILRITWRPLYTWYSKCSKHTCTTHWKEMAIITWEIVLTRLCEYGTFHWLHWTLASDSRSPDCTTSASPPVVLRWL